MSRELLEEILRGFLVTVAILAIYTAALFAMEAIK